MDLGSTNIEYGNHHGHQSMWNFKPLIGEWKLEQDTVVSDVGHSMAGLGFRIKRKSNE